MKSPVKLAGAAVAAALLTSTLGYASDQDTVVLVTAGQGQYTVQYVSREQNPTVALSVNHRSLRNDERASDGKTAAAPESIRVGQSSTVTYFRPGR